MMINFTKLLIYTFIILFFKNLAAESDFNPSIVDPVSEDWRFSSFPTLNGKGVRCISQTNDGSMVFGVNNGVLMYDGYEWTNYKDPYNFTDKTVDNLFNTNDGSLLATSPDGIFKYQDDSWQRVFPEKKHDFEFNFHSIKQISDGTIIAGLESGMLFIRNKEVSLFSSESKSEELLNAFPDVKYIHIPSRLLNSGKFERFTDVIKVSENKIWAALTKNDNEGEILSIDIADLDRIDELKVKSVQQMYGLNLGADQQFLKTKNGKIWVINKSNKKGISVFNGDSWRYIELNAFFGGDEYHNSIEESADGTVWVGGLGQVFSYDDNQWQKYKAPGYKIPTSKIILHKGNENMLWIGGLQTRVYRLDLSYDKWLTYDELNYHCESDDHSKWFIDVSGRVIQKKGDSWKAYNTDDGMMNAPVTIINTSKDQLWVAGSHQGTAATAFFDGNEWHRQVHDSLSWGIDYRAVFEARDGSLWFGGSADHDASKGQIGGLLQLKNPGSKQEKWIHHKYQENNLQQSNVYGIGQTNDGRIWIGGSYLYFYEDNYWQRTKKEPLRDYVNIVKSDDQGNLYVGSRYYGLYIYNGNKWKHFDTDDGLTSNTIISIAKGKGDNLWVVTDNDISMYNGNTWNKHVFPSTMNMANEGGSITKSSDGYIWINKSEREWKRRAFTYSNPQKQTYDNYKVYRYHIDNNPPETEITLYSEEVNKSGNTLIDWRGSDYFNQTASNKLQYSYRLNGGEWSSFTKENHHRFMNLDNGTYTFEVRAKDLDNNIDPTPAKIEFKVLPPVWKQAWFIIMIVVFLIVITVFEIRVLRKKNKLSALNDSLNNINNQLQIKNEQIEAQNKEILESRDKLEQSNQQLENQKHEIESQRDSLEEMVWKIEKLSKARIKFFTNITHEFRTPLTLITSPLDQLLNKDIPLEERKTYYSIIKRNANRLQKLINQLLEFRKIENSTLDLILRKEDLIKFTKEVKSDFNRLAEQKEISFNFNTDADEFQVVFDQDKMEKVMFNLLSNAFKHTPKQGTITLSVQTRCQNIPEELSKDRSYFKIEVMDTGKGISPKHLPHVFERYYSSEYKYNNNLEGAGIGLSYIKDLVEYHEGKIYAISDKKTGSTFTAYIPTDLKEQEYEHDDQNTFEEPSLQAEVAGEVVARSNTNGEEKTETEEVNDSHNVNGAEKNGTGQEESSTILVVEDNDDMRMFLNSVLSAEYYVLEARGGQEAINLLENNEVHLVVSDIMMEGVDGITFAKKMREEFATSHIPLILLTAKEKIENKMEGFKTGADDYVTKPFSTDLLKVRIRNLLDQREHLKRKFSQEFSVKPSDLKVTSYDEKLLDQVVEFMEEHISDSEFDVNRLCEMVNLSHMQFIRKIKALTGKKPIDLLKSFRMQRAKSLLEQDKLTISEVAYMVGYDLPNSFSRAFRKEYGVSPSEFTDKEKEVD